MDTTYLFILMVIIVIVGLIGAVAVNHFLENKRSEALRLVANELGLSYSNDRFELSDLFNRFERSFHLFSHGRSDKLRNLMQGESGEAKVAIFDYSYVIRSGKSSRTVAQTVIHFRLDQDSLPAFSLRPEQIWHEVGGWFGYQDIDFGSHPVFSRNYLLRGEDETAVRRLFTEPILNFYEVVHGLCTEGSGRNLIVYRAGVRSRPEEIGSFLNEARDVLTCFS